MTGHSVKPAKLDLMATWRRAVALLKGHWTLLTAIAGPLVFLPLAAGFLRLASSDVNWTSQNQVLVEQQLTRAFTNDWWIYVLLYLGFVLGQMTMFVLILHHKRPTVGQAIVLAAILLPSYILAWLAIQMVTELPKQLIVGAAPSMAWVSLIFTLIGLVLTIKLYVLSSVYALGESLNPVENVRRTWNLTSGNGWQIFGLSFLVGLGSIVSGLLVWIILSMLFSLFLPVSAAPSVMLALLAVVFTLVTMLFTALNIAMYQELVSANSATLTNEG